MRVVEFSWVSSSTCKVFYKGGIDIGIKKVVIAFEIQKGVIRYILGSPFPDSTHELPSNQIHLVNSAFLISILMPSILG